MSNYSKCPSCSKWVPKGDAECPHCGAQQGLGASVAGFFKGLMPSGGGDKPSNRKCVSCNRLVGLDDSECPYCGVKQTAARRFLRDASSSVPGGFRVSQWQLVVFVLLFALPLVAGGPNFSVGDYLGSGDGYTGVRLGALARNVVLVDGQVQVPRDVASFRPSEGMAYADAIAGGQYWRLVTAIFLHFGAIHLLFNSISLTYLGPLIEDLYGKGWFMVIYLVTGVAGFVASYYAEPTRVSAGASGALFGLIAIGAVTAYRHRMQNPDMVRSLMGWLLAGFVYGVVVGADNYAHGGGAVAGALMALALPAEKVSRSRRMERVGSIAGQIAGVIVVVSFIFAAVWARQYT